MTWFHLSETSRRGKFIETSTPKGWRGTWGWLLNEAKFNFGGIEHVSKLDPGGGCTTFWMFEMPLNCSLKNGSFYVTIENMHCGIRDYLSIYTIINRKKLAYSVISNTSLTLLKANNFRNIKALELQKCMLYEYSILTFTWKLIVYFIYDIECNIYSQTWKI